MLRPALSPPVALVLALPLFAGCSGSREGDDSSNSGPGLTAGMLTDGGSSGGSSGGGGGGGNKFDVEGGATDGAGCMPGEGGNCPECTAPDHTPCDGGGDPIAAIGLNCPGEPSVTIDNSIPQHPGAIGVRNKFGTLNVFDPREGAEYAVIGSGLVADLGNVTPMTDNDSLPTHCNDDLGGEYDRGQMLPPPLRTNDVGAVTCTDDPNLIGTGDCSNTIQGQFSQGGSANDYTEIRFTATVPENTNSFSYDFAFFSVEYPVYYNSTYNDMYIGWLESEAWTGNVSFDEMGNPISLNAGFLDYRDDGGNLPELAGTCMRQHAGTKWLSTTAPVIPGEQITVVFAIFDLSDSILDSYVFLDNFLWGCDGMVPPSTKPVG